MARSGASQDHYILLVVGTRRWGGGWCRVLLQQPLSNSRRWKAREKVCLQEKYYFHDLKVRCGQCSWLQIQWPGFDSRRYPIFWGVVGLERGPLNLMSTIDCLCGLVVRVPGYRTRDSGSIPGAITFFEKLWVWKGVHSASWVHLRSYLEENVAAMV
jgi:hypothetical protein